MPGTYRYDQYGNRIWHEDKGYYTATGEFVETAPPKGEPNYYELSDEEKRNLKGIRTMKVENKNAHRAADKHYFLQHTYGMVTGAAMMS